MPAPLLVTFTAGAAGPWQVERIVAIAGDTLPAAPRMAMLEGTDATPPGDAAWTLRGTTSNTRYAMRAEAQAMQARQEGLARPRATCGVLIPINKSEAWWALAQDERRRIFEEQSRHIGIGMDYLPEVARRLHHGRDLGEPFDFLTWFEFAPEHEAAFDAMLVRLRETEEWRYVDREVEVRLRRA